jgi:hypothetical protein
MHLTNMGSHPANEFEVKTFHGDDGAVGATAVFPFDRSTADRFRKAFPRSRWRDDLRAWFVPGTKAAARVSQWLEAELSAVLPYADEKGKDAFTFDPIESRYLEVGDDIRIRTPYSKSIVTELRNVPWARWDSENRVWRVPFRSWEALRRRWPAIEIAARRNEPEEVQKRRESRKGSPEHRETVAKSRERRRHRYPVSVDALPPLNRVLMTKIGCIVFTEIQGECADDEIVDRFYADVSTKASALVWATWRKPTHAELVETWPTHRLAKDRERDRRRGWWDASLDELRDERRRARSMELARSSEAAIASTNNTAA